MASSVHPVPATNGDIFRGVPVTEAVEDLRTAWISRYIDDREIALQK